MDPVPSVPDTTLSTRPVTIASEKLVNSVSDHRGANAASAGETARRSAARPRAKGGRVIMEGMRFTTMA